MNATSLTAVQHPKMVRHPKSPGAAPATVVAAPNTATGPVGPNNRRLILSVKPQPLAPKGSGGTGTRRTPKGFFRSQDGGVNPTDSRGTTPLQTRAQAVGRVGLNSQVLSADPAVQQGLADPHSLQPGNAAYVPEGPTQKRPLRFFISDTGKIEWFHVAIGVGIGALIIAAVRK